MIFVSKTSNANKIKFTVLSISPAPWRELQRKLFYSLKTQTLSVKHISGITLPTGLFLRVAWREADTMVTSGRRPEHKGVDMSCELSPQNRHEWPPLSPALAPHVNPTSQQPVQGRPTDFFTGYRSGISDLSSRAHLPTCGSSRLCCCGGCCCCSRKKTSTFSWIDYCFFWE